MRRGVPLWPRAARSTSSRSTSREDDGGDPYLHAQTVLEAWLQQGIVVREREPALWAMTQDYTGPDGRAYTRHGFFARVRVEDYGPGRIRPHERTQPGPKEDRLRLTRATRANLSPIFSLYPDERGEVWSALAGATGASRTRPSRTTTAPSTGSGASRTPRPSSASRR